MAKTLEEKREYARRYYMSPAAREYQKRYRDSHRKELKRWRELHKKETKEYNKKYINSVHGKEVREAYINSTAGKKCVKKRESSAHRKKWVKKYCNSFSVKTRRRNQALMRNYGITIAQRNKMLREQHGRCYICKKPETLKGRKGKIRRLSVHHNHESKKVHHLLCHICNVLIAYLQKRRIDLKYYLRYPKEPPSGIMYNHKLPYGISTKLRNKMLREQGGVCYICKKHETVKHNDDRIWHLSVDHNSKTDMIRHLLCNSCNILVGMLRVKRTDVKYYMLYLNEEEKIK